MQNPGIKSRSHNSHEWNDNSKAVNKYIKVSELYLSYRLTFFILCFGVYRMQNVVVIDYVYRGYFLITVDNQTEICRYKLQPSKCIGSSHAVLNGIKITANVLNQTMSSKRKKISQARRNFRVVRLCDCVMAHIILVARSAYASWHITDCLTANHNARQWHCHWWKLATLKDKGNRNWRE